MEYKVTGELMGGKHAGRRFTVADYFKYRSYARMFIGDYLKGQGRRFQKLRVEEDN